MCLDLEPHRYKNLKRLTNYTMHLPSLAQCAATIPYFTNSCPLPTTHTQNNFAFLFGVFYMFSLLVTIIWLVIILKFIFLPSPICILLIKKGPICILVFNLSHIINLIVTSFTIRKYTFNIDYLEHFTSVLKQMLKVTMLNVWMLTSVLENWC